MTSLSILEVTKSTGGVGEYVRWLAGGLDKSIFNLTVACLSEGGEILASDLKKIPGVDAFNLSMERYRISPLSDARLVLKLDRHLREHRYDLIHAHASKPGFLTRLAARGSGIPVIYSPHCFSFHPGTHPLKANVLAALERFAARYWTTRFLFVAEGERSLAQKYGVGRPDQFRMVYSGVAPLEFQGTIDRSAQRRLLGLPPEGFVVGSIGRLGTQKAPLDFIRAAGILSKVMPEVHFIWIGSGPLKEEAQRQAELLGLANQMHFPGHRTDIAACLAVMDCYVQTSHWEGFPLVILEAMAAGVPVIATDIPGTNEAIQSGKDGLLVPLADPQACSQAIRQILSDPGLANQFRQAAKEKVSTRFNRQQMLSGVTQVYLETAQRGVS